MKTLESYIEKIGGAVEEVDEGNYGHYPFTLVSIPAKGPINLCGLSMGGNVVGCYRIFGEHMKKADKVFMTMDFPAQDEMKKDFLCIFSYQDGKIEAELHPYDNKTGVKDPPVHQAPLIETLKKQMALIIKLENEKD